ncbi:MAG: AmmeMemoRadiSam system protein A [Leptospirales bacterium]
MDELSEKDKFELLRIARTSIEHGVKEHAPYSPDLVILNATLNQDGACFCTLRMNDQLKGCIGTLEAFRPLAVDVAENSYASGFRDTRFSNLVFSDLDKVDIELSILGKLTPIKNMDDTELLRYLSKSKPGMVAQMGSHKGTFLPSVWDTLPEPSRFLEELKKKAGLDPKEDSLNIQYNEYTVEKFAEKRNSI